LIHLEGESTAVCTLNLLGLSAIEVQAIGADRQLLASTGTDATIRFWDVATGECVKNIRSPRPYEGMNIRSIPGLTAAQQENLTTKLQFSFTPVIHTAPSS
jgi:WD40 repeat protein